MQRLARGSLLGSLLILAGCGSSSTETSHLDGSPDGSGGQRQDGGPIPGDGGAQDQGGSLADASDDTRSPTQADGGAVIDGGQDGQDQDSRLAADSGTLKPDLGGGGNSDGGGTINPNQDGGADGSVGTLLSVVSTDPIDGGTGVPLNKSYRIVFDGPLPADASTDKISVTDSSGKKVAGQIVITGSVLEFLPGRYKASELHTVTIAGTFGLKDGQAKTFTFTTGTTNLDGTTPPPDDVSPFGKKGEAVALSPLAELGLAWTRREYHTSHWDHADYAGNRYLALEDPPFNPSPLTNPSSPNSNNKFWKESASLGTNENEPFVGQFDSDLYQEIAVVSRASDGTIALTIQDTSSSGALSTVNTGLIFASADTFAAATGDFDNDHRDELLLALGKGGESPRWYVVKWNEATNTYQIKTQDVLPISSYVYVRVAAGDMDGDGKAEAAFVWHVAPAGGGSNPSTIKYSVYSDMLAASRTVRVDARTIVSNVAGRWGDDWRPYVDVVAADLDGDGAAELAFGLNEFIFLWNSANNQYRCIVIQQRLFVADHYSAPVLIGATTGTETYAADRAVYRPHASAGGAMAGKEGYMVGAGWGKWGDEKVHRPMSGLVAGRLSGDNLRNRADVLQPRVPVQAQFQHRSGSGVIAGAGGPLAQDHPGVDHQSGRGGCRRGAEWPGSD